MTAVRIVELGIQVRCLGVLNTRTSLFFVFFTSFLGFVGRLEKEGK